MKKSQKLFGASLLALAISGCAVTSEPIERSVSEQRAKADLQSMYKGQEPLSGPLTLHQAMARAVKYNLEGRLKIMEEALAKRQLDLASFDMLPRMALDAGYVGRNNVSASSSQSVRTGTQSLEPSTSQDRDRNVADLTMVWNVLDFGVSYINAKQQGDQRLIVQERRRKVINTIVQDVRSAYWRAMAAERLLKQIDSLMARVDTARRNSESMSEQRIGDPVQSLGYQRSLIEATRQLEEQRRALSLAKTELATLINLPLGTNLTLATDDGYQIPELKVDISRLEQEALTSRPELREQDYQTRISAAETRKAMLRMLPGLEFSAGGHYDSNSFLVNDRWADYGVKVTWNLFNVISAPAAIDVAKAGEEVATARRQAMSIAVLAQLYVANANYQEALRQFKTNQQLSDIDGQIVGQLRNRHQAAGIGELELIQGELNNLQADLRRDLSYADLRNAYGQIFASAGLDPLPDQVQSTEVQSIATALANRESAWASGDISVPVVAHAAAK
ncbi:MULTISPECIES: TolC family protein [Pseudomonas]|jgi:outer membrane protein TolC|uniref:TolC family protein n=1 Tax=Pseudomonas moraviensis TaxID=321662 RepID=A0A2A2PKT3_9PSED|nr:MULTISPECIES: TolC family protein [Pseudomonas]MBA5981449.1 TolC family protein [Pseudomonas sp. MD195_PC81_125]PAW56178.1 TolC family protein [Pseudomonas moraviensis]PAW59666.1 TolC family protein [Pseudomonas moraviensis]QXE07650.1 TolC family protein [Pseudomonas sp. AN-B15]ULN81515.1 TolC family protein [Pseudomonas sp. Y5-11]